MVTFAVILKKLQILLLFKVFVKDCFSWIYSLINIVFNFTEIGL